MDHTETEKPNARSAARRRSRAGCSRSRAAPPQAARVANVNGAPGLLLRDADGVLSVIALTVDQGLITSVDIFRNPDKLLTVPEP